MTDSRIRYIPDPTLESFYEVVRDSVAIGCVWRVTTALWAARTSDGIKALDLYASRNDAAIWLEQNAARAVAPGRLAARLKARRQRLSEGVTAW